MTETSTKIVTLSPCRRILGTLIILFSILCIAYYEIQLGNQLAPQNDVIKEAYLLPTDSKVIKSFNRDVVMLQSNHVSSHPSYAPRDPSFDVQLGTQLELHRIVEYCQWHEVKPVNQTEGKVEYYKDWSDEIIDSSTFEILEGYNNSQRNPFPKRDMIPKYVDAGAFHVSYSFLENLNIPSQRFEFSPENNKHIPYPTFQNGFYYATPYWIYGRQSMERLGQAAQYTELQWVSSEEEEKLENECDTGDIRIGFEYKECPRVLTVVGVQNDNMILPVRKVMGTYNLALPYNATADDLLNDLNAQAIHEVYLIRLYCGLGVFVGMFVMVGNFVPFRYVPHFIRCVLTAVLSMYLVCLSIWIAIYGFDNTFVIQGCVWFASHLVLAILINVMFYMIRLYRFALKLEKEKKSE